jgi:hypothetical protein
VHLRFELARAEDDAELRALLRRTPMPGRVSLAFLREPSFFIAEEQGNIESQVIVARDVASGAIVGAGCRSIRRMYVNGRETTAGYLSMLRGVPEVRGGTGLARGYRFLRALHADGKAPFYVTTILDENVAAASLLSSGRAGLPTYERVGSLRTFLIPIARRRRSRVTAALVAADASLDLWNRRHQFAPVSPAPLPLYAIKRGDETLGTFAVWDQQSFKQTVVTSYAPRVRMARPFYNALARLHGRPRLPDVGEPIRLVYGACISADDPNVFDALLDHACAQWSGRGHDYLAIGLSRDHLLSPAAAARAARTIDSSIYIVYWNEKERPALDGRLPHLEIATL